MPPSQGIPRDGGGESREAPGLQAAPGWGWPGPRLRQERRGRAGSPPCRISLSLLPVRSCLPPCCRWLSVEVRGAGSRDGRCRSLSLAVVPHCRISLCRLGLGPTRRIPEMAKVRKATAPAGHGPYYPSPYFHPHAFLFGLP